jgi:HEAT repeat protein
VKFTAHEEIIALGRIGEDARDAIPVLIKLLDSQDWSTRGEAIDALVQIGPSSSAVMNALANRFDDPRAVYQATNYGELAKPLAPKLIKLLDSKSRPIRIWAAYGLVKSGNDEPRGFDVLIGDVAAGTVEDRSLAATALAALGNQAQSMIPKLRAYQNDPDERVAKEVLEAIRRIERDDRIFTHAQEAAKAAAARKATKKALWYLDGNR